MAENLSQVKVSRTAPRVPPAAPLPEPPARPVPLLTIASTVIPGKKTALVPLPANVVSKVRQSINTEAGSPSGARAAALGFMVNCDSENSALSTKIIRRHLPLTPIRAKEQRRSSMEELRAPSKEPAESYPAPRTPSPASGTVISRRLHDASSTSLITRSELGQALNLDMEIGLYSENSSCGALSLHHRSLVHTDPEVDELLEVLDYACVNAIRYTRPVTPSSRQELVSEVQLHQIEILSPLSDQCNQYSFSDVDAAAHSPKSAGLSSSGPSRVASSHRTEAEDGDGFTSHHPGSPSPRAPPGGSATESRFRSVSTQGSACFDRDRIEMLCLEIDERETTNRQVLMMLEQEFWSTVIEQFVEEDEGLKRKMLTSAQPPSSPPPPSPSVAAAPMEVPLVPPPDQVLRNDCPEPESPLSSPATPSGLLIRGSYRSFRYMTASSVTNAEVALRALHDESLSSMKGLVDSMLEFNAYFLAGIALQLRQCQFHSAVGRLKTKIFTWEARNLVKLNHFELLESHERGLIEYAVFHHYKLMMQSIMARPPPAPLERTRAPNRGRDSFRNRLYAPSVYSPLTPGPSPSSNSFASINSEGDWRDAEDDLAFTVSGSMSAKLRKGDNPSFSSLL